MRGKNYPSEPPALAGAEAPRGLKSAAHYMGICMSARSRHVVYNETFALEMSAAAVDLERLRRGFAELFDGAARAVQLAGYEQDDAVFERYLVLRTADGAEITIEAEWLADRERLMRQIAEETQKAKTQKRVLAMERPEVSIIGIRVEAVVE